VNDERAKAEILEQLRGGLIVSCQAEGEDPFNNPEEIARFARAAEMGGACGIRAREVENIQAVRQAVALPIIGITKAEYPNGRVLITPDFDDIRAIVRAGSDIVALDATDRVRPNGLRGQEFLARVKGECDRPLMADISNAAEAVAAVEAGGDLVGLTLSGYTPETEAAVKDEPDWALLEEVLRLVDVPVILEGRVWTPAQARRGIEYGAFAVVVGTAITRPRLITMRFVEAVRGTAADS
jgi:N-acylglucosamine-6-phosphate 2-epimerase